MADSVSSVGQGSSSSLSDLLSQMGGSGSSSSTSQSSSSSQTQSDQLVQAYKQSQQPSLDTLAKKQQDLQKRLSFYGTLNSKLNNLISNIDTFTASNSNSKFVTRTITSSDSNIMTATATSDAVVGVNTVKVNRLATNDNLISQRLNLSSDFGDISGTHTFNLTVNNITTSIDVNFDNTETNEQAMTKIVNAINTKYDQINSADTTLDNTFVTASYIKDTNNTGRITFTASKTGDENKVTFSGEQDADNGILAKLGLTTSLFSDSANRTVSNGGTSGYRTADSKNLDSEILINGVTVTRSSNAIDDILPGITLNLLKPDTDEVVLNTSVDTKAVESLINPIISSYNDLLTFSKSDTDILRKDTSINSLSFDLRGLSVADMNQVSSGDTTTPKNLFDIGLKVASDGTLSISDETKLTDALKKNPQQVAVLFTNPGDPNDSTKPSGLAARLNDTIKSFTGQGGLILAKQKMLNDQIDQTAKKTTDLQTKIDAQAETLRNQYESQLSVYLQAQQQLNLLGSYSSTTGASS
jgi:flagellar hook-associated protein 2